MSYPITSIDPNDPKLPEDDYDKELDAEMDKDFGSQTSILKEIEHKQELEQVDAASWEKADMALQDEQVLDLKRFY